MAPFQILRILKTQSENIIFVNVGENSRSHDPLVINIPWIGNESDLAQLYSALDSLIFPSIADNCPLVILEAISCGLPVVAFDTGGIPEIVRDGYEGFVVKGKDVNLLVKRIIELARNSTLKNEFCQNARKRAVKRFDHKIIVQEYFDVYEHCITNWNNSEIRSFSTANLPEILSTEGYRKYLYKLGDIFTQIDSQKSNYVNVHKRVENVLRESKDKFKLRKQQSNLLNDSFRKGIPRAVQEIVNENQLDSSLTAPFKRSSIFEIGKPQTNDRPLRVRPTTCSNPLISVITPSFNQSQFIEQTIQSVLNQSCSNFEHIIMDGGSTDGTVEILKKYPHLKWNSGKDSGQTHALNKGLKMAQGDIIAWINSDDYYPPDVFQKVVNGFNNQPNANILFGDCVFTSENHSQKTVVKNRELSFEEILRYWDEWIPPTQPTIFFKSELLAKFGNFDETLNYAMDYDFWLRISRENRFYHIPEILAVYRFHSESKSGLGSDWTQPIQNAPIKCTSHYFKYRKTNCARHGDNGGLGCCGCQRFATI
jgi:hypothetical protein